MRYFKILGILFFSLGRITSGQELVQEGRFWMGSFSKSFPVTQHGLLLVSQVQGDVEITTWEKSEVRIRAALRMSISSQDDASNALFEIENACLKRGDTVMVQGTSFAREWIQCRLEITLPKQFGCDIGLNGGSVSVSGLDGSVDARTGGGAIALSDVRGPCNVKTGGGPITLIRIEKRVTASSGGGAMEISHLKGEVTASTGGGEIHVLDASNGVSLSTGGGEINVLDSEGDIQIQTGGGNIRSEKINGNLHGSTGGGTVEVDEITGSVECRTGGGDVTLNKIAGPIHARTGAGNIEAECVLTKLSTGEEMRLQTGSGNIVISLSDKLSCTIDARTRSTGFGWQSNQINSEFPLSIRSTKNEIHATGQINNGGPNIWLETKDGNIQIKKSN